MRRVSASGQKRCLKWACQSAERERDAVQQGTVEGDRYFPKAWWEICSYLPMIFLTVDFWNVMIDSTTLSSVFLTLP
jgi:hypothetical protein